ncbi:uncharacterized protein [Setaria viridis]|uniref:uncharacterized protein n=1 Tax=Setaria viridis TaxID=4556 RepID=UPI003B3AC710
MPSSPVMAAFPRCHASSLPRHSTAELSNREAEDAKKEERISTWWGSLSTGARASGSHHTSSNTFFSLLVSLYYVEAYREPIDTHCGCPYPLYTPKSLEYRVPRAFPKTMNLGVNNFTGVIPKEIAHLKALLSLNLSSKKLTGVIPHSSCKLINIQVLDLSGNHLTGGIPSELNNLHYLSEFNVSNNDLEGPIPIIGQLSTFTSSSFDGNPRLCGPMLAHQCGSTEEIFTTEVRIQTDEKITFAIAFCAFFSVGVLYDQIVLSRFFG